MGANMTISLWMGAGMLLYVLACGLRYGKEITAWKDGGRIWGLCGAMGFAMTVSGGGNSFFLSLQGILGAAAALCCLVQLHREKLFRQRRRERFRKEARMSREKMERAMVRERPVLRRVPCGGEEKGRSTAA